jgi:polysaccharide deacetylase 2 family uncharacterized protein YibQ
VPRSRAQSRYRTAVALLVLAAAGLAAVLVSCPRPKRPDVRLPSPAAVGPAGGTTSPPTRPESAGGVSAAPAAVPIRPVEGGRLALVIDDAGYDLDELQPFLELPMPLAIAVLPNLPHSVEAARRVRSAGKELLLHLPMEPEGGQDPGPGALLTGQSAGQIERLLAAALESVPGAVGVNNHMGSKATADAVLMADLLDALQRRGLFFVDSRTTPHTVGDSEAARRGVPYLARRVFLDVVDGGIEKSLQDAVEAAARQGSAVAIGHVQTAGLAAILRRAADSMERSGVRPSTLSALIEAQEGRGSE